MPVYALLIWLVIGAVIGFLARRILGKAGPFGLIGDIVVGIVGAIIGGYLLGLLGATGSSGILVSFLAALVGAILLLWILGKVIKR
ncbi:MAG: GlsB/YeaQ/YmgE family stress response membrane protein [Dehalococcoidia bacterium]|jgi:uncharacterized membrane protein YeaQ/YmgE (transglycosylase-associated protein family)|nr:GlsB/YeaQ/YmgE family stress response membrane protein [Dehalococcoidia bacterium]